MNKLIEYIKYMYQAHRQYNILWEKYLEKKCEIEKHNNYVRKIRG